VLVLLLAASAVAGAGGVGLGCTEGSGGMPSTVAGITETSVAATTGSLGATQPSAGSTTTTYYVHPIANPVRVVIPAIDVDAKMVHVGLEPNGWMEVPPLRPSLPGTSSARPRAPTVRLWSPPTSDSKKGPDVFFHLKKLETGDEVRVYGDDGDFATFVVDSKETTAKDELPVDRIWVDSYEPLIRLVTCGGEFDRSTGHYRSNVIVYGHLTK